VRKRDPGGQRVIELRRAQLSFGDGLIAEEVSDLREAWMRHADQVLADEQIVASVYDALAKRRPQSRSRGRKGTPAETVLRLLVLKHVRNWSYEPHRVCRRLHDLRGWSHEDIEELFTRGAGARDPDGA
jgi:hypothetical protein